MTGARKLFLLLLFLAAPLLLPACGKKGPLIPPEALVPAPISDLAVAQKGAQFQVSWSAPSREEGGARLTDLAGFLLFRHTVLPPAEDCEECPTAYQQLARVDLDYLQGVKRVEGRYLLDDGDLTRGKTYQYKIRSFNTDGTESKDSNKVRRTFAAPPPPPVLEALPSASGVVLAFVAVPPPEGSLVGYNIYRSKEGAAMPLHPLNPSPLTGTTYEDKETLIGVRYSYWVTTLAKVNGEIVEGNPSNMAAGAMSERD